MIYEVTIQQDELSRHLLLGQEATERQQVKIQEIQDVLATWKEKSTATAYDDAS